MAAYVKKLTADAICPKFAHPGEDAGADVFSCENIVIAAGSRKCVSTGLSIQPPPGTYIHIAPKSGLSNKKIDIGAGIVDSGYRGVIKVLMINNSDIPFQIKKEMKIAQIIFKKIAIPEIVECDTLPESSRGTGGFGSTGRY